MEKLISVWGWEANPFADPRKAHDGGGYSQPCGGAVYAFGGGRLLSIEVEDTSCGDFGTRYYATIDSGHQRWQFAWGTMDGLTDLSPKEYRLLRKVTQKLRLNKPLWELVDDTFAAAALVARRGAGM